MLTMVERNCVSPIQPSPGGPGSAKLSTRSSTEVFVLVGKMNSGFSKPRFCQTYVLQFGVFHENGGNHENDENDENNSDSHKQGGRLLDLRNHGKARK